MDGQIASPRSPGYPDSDIMSEASFRGSNSDSDYVKSAENSPAISANTSDLEGNTIKLEKTNKVSEGEIDAIV